MNEATFVKYIFQRKKIFMNCQKFANFINIFLCQNFCHLVHNIVYVSTVGWYLIFWKSLSVNRCVYVNYGSLATKYLYFYFSTIYSYVLATVLSIFYSSNFSQCQFIKNFPHQKSVLYSSSTCGILLTCFIGVLLIHWEF